MHPKRQPLYRRPKVGTFGLGTVQGRPATTPVLLHQQDWNEIRKCLSNELYGIITILEDRTKMSVHISLSDIADFILIFKNHSLEKQEFKNINYNVFGNFVIARREFRNLNSSINYTLCIFHEWSNQIKPNWPWRMTAIDQSTFKIKWRSKAKLVLNAFHLSKLLSKWIT